MHPPPLSGHQSADILISLSLPVLVFVFSFPSFLREVEYLCVVSSSPPFPLEEKRESKMRGDHSLAIIFLLPSRNGSQAEAVKYARTRYYSRVGKFSRASVHLAVERGSGGGGGGALHGATEIVHPAEGRKESRGGGGRE